MATAASFNGNATHAHVVALVAAPSHTRTVPSCGALIAAAEAGTGRKALETSAAPLRLLRKVCDVLCVGGGVG